MSINAQLRTLRKQNNLTLADVNRDTGLSVSFLSDMERGRVNPSLETIEKLSELYGVTFAFNADVGNPTEYLRYCFTERELRLMLNCVEYATGDPAGLPAHNLMLIIHKLLSTLRVYRGELVEAIGNEPTGD